MTTTTQHRSYHWILSCGIILLLALSPAGAAEMPFGTENVILDSSNTVNFPIGIALGDMNMDGFDDLVMCAEDSGQVWKHLAGNVSGSTIATGLDSPRSADIGDIDGDGDMDVIVGQYNNIASGGQAEILWYEFDAYTWIKHDIYHLSSTGVRSIKLVDIDGDGDLDYVLAAEGDPDQANSSISWQANTLDTGTMGWSSVFHYLDTSVQRPWDVEVVDLDSDGDPDVVAADVGADTIEWYENDGTPSSGWTTHSIRTGFDGANSVTIADVDGDGNPDVIASALIDDRISWFENSSWTEHNVVLGIDGPATVKAADLDFDGDFDLVVTRSVGDEVLWIENKGSSLWQRRTIDAAFDGAYAAVPFDQDRDGDLDVAAVGYNADSLSWWENQNTHRRFAETDPITVRDSLNDPRAVAVADINGDGLQDMVLGGNGDAWLRVYLQFDETTWWENTVDTGVSHYRDVSVADMDHDGDLDVLAASTTADAIYWWANDGAALPSWTQHTILSSFNGAHTVEPVDLDGDGDFDVVVCAFDADESTIVMNDNGVGTSWTKKNFTPLNGAYDVAVGDLNRDGMPDFVSTGYYEDVIRVDIQGSPLWGFTDITGLDGPRGVSLGDVDDDGDLDIVAVIRNDDDIKWFENDGVGGTWTAHNVGSGYLNGGSEVQAVDVDHDGDIDVLATGFAGDDVYLWKNDGDGSSWDWRIIESSLDSPWQALAADVNGDNNMDLVLTAAGTTDSLTWYKNLGAQFSVDQLYIAPSSISEGEKAPVYYFGVNNQGRSGDHDLEMKTLVLEFTDSSGTPLTSTQVNNIIDRMEIYLDESPLLDWDEGVDTLVATDSYLSLSGGTLTYSFSHGLTGNHVSPDDYGAFFVVLEAASDASQYSPNEIIVTMKTDQLESQDRSAQIPLIGEPADDVSTGVITIGAGLFSDGFESGNTTAWTATVGG